MQNNISQKIESILDRLDKELADAVSYKNKSLDLLRENAEEKYIKEVKKQIDL